MVRLFIDTVSTYMERTYTEMVSHLIYFDLLHQFVASNLGKRVSRNTLYHIDANANAFVGGYDTLFTKTKWVDVLKNYQPRLIFKIIIINII